jgi:hypothetical protein
VSDRAAFEKEVMDLAHASWNQKERLQDEIRSLSFQLADNIYEEYFRLRGSSGKAAYDVACNDVDEFLKAIAIRVRGLLQLTHRDQIVR